MCSLVRLLILVFLTSNIHKNRSHYVSNYFTFPADLHTETCLPIGITIYSNCTWLKDLKVSAYHTNIALVLLFAIEQKNLI